MSTKTITVRQIRSSIGYRHDQRETLRGLRLLRMGAVAKVPDTPAMRGMLHKVRHLVKIEES
jgi:large subunit ribosomal protein L30